MKNLLFFMKYNGWISKPLMIYCGDSNYIITSKNNRCLVKVYQIFLQKLKIGNTRSDINQWDLPDKFLLNGESVTNKANIIKNMKIRKQ